MWMTISEPRVVYTESLELRTVPPGGSRGAASVRCAQSDASEIQGCLIDARKLCQNTIARRLI